jgi:hypothetical protein
VWRSEESGGGGNISGMRGQWSGEKKKRSCVCGDVIFDMVHWQRGRNLLLGKEKRETRKTKRR